MKIKRNIIFVLTFLLPSILFANSETHQRNIVWKGIQTFPGQGGESIQMLRFEGSVNEPKNDFLPMYFESFQLPDGHNEFNANLVNLIFGPLTAEEAKMVTGVPGIHDEIKLQSKLTFDRKKPFASISFIPVRINEITGQPEKLIRFGLENRTQSGFFS